MTVDQRVWTQASGWSTPATPLSRDASMVLLFGSTAALQSPELIASLTVDYPQALFFGSSTAGEIAGTRVLDHSLIATALSFSHTAVRSALVPLSECPNSRQAGESLARQLPPSWELPGSPAPLTHVLVLSDGLQVNGSELVNGITQALPKGVTLTGGLAGDGDAFRTTVVLCGAHAQSGVVAAVGFYGNRLRVGFASQGGWDPFGPERLITRSAGNVLRELDGMSALALYKQYLGEHSKALPSTGLLFPLSIREPDSDAAPVVRTILAIDENDQSMTFAGDVPEGSYARLMKANFERLIDGAVGAARTSQAAIGAASPEFALLISCVGRRLVLRQRV